MIRWIALLVLICAGPPAAAAERPACSGSTHEDYLAGVSPEGDLRLASGRIGRLLDIRLPGEAAAHEEALGWLRGHGGQALLVAAGAPDRWGRVPVLAAPGAFLDLAAGLVSAGLALVDAGEQAGLCRADLLQREADARGRRLGLWAGDAQGPIAADASERLLERVGRFVLVEGDIASVGERGARIYLNFGRLWSDDFTIIVPKHVWGMLAHRGHTAASLKGRRIRARGVLEAWNGPALTLHAAEMIEILPREPSRRAGPATE